MRKHEQITAIKFMIAFLAIMGLMCAVAIRLETANLSEHLPGWLKYLAQNLWTWIKWLWGCGAFLITTISIINLIRNHVKRRKEKAHNN